MPLFEYVCRDCSHRFERLHSYRSRAPRCPECGGRSERQLSAPAIQFKGTGFYITDYARKDKGSAAEESGKDDKSDTKDKKDKKATSDDKSGSSNGAKKTGKSTANSTKKADSSSSDS